MTKDIKDKLAVLSTHVNYVSKGYTCIAQSIDMGINSTFKQEYCCLYSNWFVAASKVSKDTNKKVKVSLCLVVASFASKALQGITTELVKKTCVHITSKTKTNMS